MSEGDAAPFFSSPREAPRERSGSDVLTALVSLAILLAVAPIAVPTSGFERSLVGVLQAVPSFLDALWRLGVAAGLVWTAVLIVVVAWRRRWDVAVDQALALVGTCALGVALARALNGSIPSVAELVTGGSEGAVPLVGVAVLAALTASAAPNLARPWRRAGRWAVGATVAGALSTTSTTPGGAALSVACASLAAASVHVVRGTSAGRPDPDRVGAALRASGVAVGPLVPAATTRSGVARFTGRVEGSGDVDVAVYGRDARDTQLLARLRRSLWYRGWQPIAASRRHQVEHEAFVTLLAAARGVSVPEVLTARQLEGRDAVLVTTARGRALDELDDVPGDAEVADAWRLLGELHAAGLSHGAVTPAAFRRLDGTTSIGELASAGPVESPDQLVADRAQLLVSTALLVGIERAAVVAAEHLGDDRLAEVLPYLQPAALTPDLRAALRRAEWTLDALRAGAAGVAGTEVPELVELRRVRPATAGTVVLLALVAFSLVSSLGGIDLSQLWAELRGASPGWALAALALAQVGFVFTAVGTRGASPKPLPFAPVVLFEAAIAFIGLAVPSTAGRVALGIRFFQRQGVPATSAVSISAVDSFAGFLVQAALLLLTLAVGVGHVELDLSMPADRSFGRLVTILLVAVAVVVVLAVVALSLPAVRARVLQRLRPVWAEITTTVAALRSPGKLVQLLGGNLAYQLLLGAVLGAALHAFGGRLNLATLVVISVGAALFGGLMPVPGGIGVMEAALMAGLVAAGIEAPVASATALLFRAVTFYLPPLWGFVAMRWLQRHGYL